jgi:hypothetical protein
MQQRGIIELDGTIYLAPFKWQLWIAIMAAMLLLAFSLSVGFYMAYCNAKIEQQHYSLSQRNYTLCSIESVSQSFFQSVNHSIGQSIGQTISQSIIHPVRQLVSRLVSMLFS